MPDKVDCGYKAQVGDVWVESIEAKPTRRGRKVKYEFEVCWRPYIYRRNIGGDCSNKTIAPMETEIDLTLGIHTGSTSAPTCSDEPQIPITQFKMKTKAANSPVCRSFTTRGFPKPASKSPPWLTARPRKQTCGEQDVQNDPWDNDTLQQRPDLTITPTTLEVVDLVSGGHTVTQHFDVCNRGSTVSGVQLGFSTGHEKATTKQPKAYGEVGLVSNPIANNACVDYEHEFFTPTGTFAGFAMVDAVGAVKETKEGNNATRFLYGGVSVSASTPGAPDRGGSRGREGGGGSGSSRDIPEAPSEGVGGR